MIESIFLLNFQKHRKKKIPLDKIVTFLGRSDSGKSSILRALKWVMLNFPRGTSFITHGESRCVVKLKVDEHVIVRQRREKRENSYRLDGSSSFDAMGAAGSVPEEIRTILNVSDLNFQDQLSQPFWFCLTPGEVARELNSVINLGMIDRVFSSVSSQLKRARTEESVCQERLTTSIREREKLHWVTRCERDFKALEALEDDTISRASEIARLASLTEQADNLTVLIQNASMVASYGLKIVSLFESVAATAERVENLEELIMEYRSNQLDYTDLPNMEGLSELIGTLIARRQRLSLLSKLVQELRDVEKDLCHENTQVEKLKARLAKEKTCPLCGRSKGSR